MFSVFMGEQVVFSFHRRTDCFQFSRAYMLFLVFMGAQAVFGFTGLVGFQFSWVAQTAFSFHGRTNWFQSLWTKDRQF